MNWISARHLARTLSMTAALIASATIASAGAQPAFADRGNGAVLRGAVASQPPQMAPFVLDQPLLALNDVPAQQGGRGVVWAGSDAFARVASDAVAGQTPSPRPLASFLATVALVVFFFLRRMA